MGSDTHQSDRQIPFRDRLHTHQAALQVYTTQSRRSVEDGHAVLARDCVSIWAVKALHQAHTAVRSAQGLSGTATSLLHRGEEFSRAGKDRD